MWKLLLKNKMEMSKGPFEQYIHVVSRLKLCQLIRYKCCKNGRSTVKMKLLSSYSEEKILLI